MCEPDVFIILWSNVKIRENINNMAWIYGEQLIIHHVLLGAAGLIWTNCNNSQGSTRIGLLLWLVVLCSDEHVLWTLIQNTRIVSLWYRQVSGIAEVPACISSIWETSENYREYTVDLRTCFIDCYKTVSWGLFNMIYYETCESWCFQHIWQSLLYHCIMKNKQLSE